MLEISKALPVWLFVFQIDEDFIAQYQMNYGAGSEQASGTDERNQNNKEHWDAYHTQQGEEDGTKYVEGMDINSEEYYNWYYKNYYAQNHPQDQPPQGEQQGNDGGEEEGEGKEEGGKKGKKRKVSKFLAQKPVEGTHVLNFIVEIALLFKPLVSVSYCHINFKFYYICSKTWELFGIVALS